MITITCTNCQATLTMDEAFAGGVCRCQYCGTIQTVPKHTHEGGESSGMIAQAGGSQRTLWRQKGTAEASQGTGLDDLADIVASSGLTGSGLKSNRLRKAGPPSQPKRNPKLVPILAGAGGAIVLAIIVIVVMYVGNHGNENNAGNNPPTGTSGVVGNPGANPDGNSTPTPAVPAGPNFAGLDLRGAHTVVFILDRGSGSANVLGAMKGMTLKSISSLTADRKFQIIFWQVRQECITYPEGGPTLGGDISLGEATRKLDDVAAFGSSTVGPALKAAAAANPDTIILATGKSDDLPDTFAAEVDANRPPGAKIDTFSVGGLGASPVLAAIAKETGGEYRNLTNGDLQTLAH